MVGGLIAQQSRQGQLLLQEERPSAAQIDDIGNVIVSHGHVFYSIWKMYIYMIRFEEEEGKSWAAAVQSLLCLHFFHYEFEEKKLNFSHFCVMVCYQAHTGLSIFP